MSFPVGVGTNDCVDNGSPGTAPLTEWYAAYNVNWRDRLHTLMGIELLQKFAALSNVQRPSLLRTMHKASNRAAQVLLLNEVDHLGSVYKSTRVTKISVREDLARDIVPSPKALVAR